MLIWEKEEVPKRPKLSAWDNEEDADDKLKQINEMTNSKQHLQSSESVNS
jgi:hypothetical protein